MPSTSIDPAQIVYPSAEVSPYPYEHFAALRHDAPVHRVPGRNEYLVSRHEDIVAVMRQPDLFSNLVFLTEGGNVRAATLADVNPRRVGPIFSSDPPAHTLKRRLAFEYFKPARLPSYAPLITECVDGMIDRFIERGTVEFVSEFAMLLPIKAILGILDFPEDALARALVWSTYDGHGNRYQEAERRSSLEDGIRDQVDYVRRIVERRHARPGTDVVSCFVRDRVEANGGALDLPNVTAEVVNMINGGMHTTGFMVGSAMQMLLEHPVELARVAAQRELIPRLFEEALRLEAPLQWTGRLVLEDAEVGGVAVPAGSLLLLLLASANRDDEVFECPAELRLDRPNVKAHLAFGTHIHSCLGAPLARLEGQIAFERLFDRLENIRYAPGAGAPAPVESFNFRGPSELQLAFDAR